ncbi:FadR/GntR family transcriptional regulator [Paenibacillus sp. MBLB4367]|uniref:FadR/GntR family transcriptional regulator n=1 Tax=Paenibacillus sp. MBLB4367 TaxID=3384767 RepID=UPI0039082CB6
MELKQASRTTLVEQVASQMEAHIEAGKWPVGTRIPAEPELVQQLGVSRNTVREAVRALIHAGLLAARPGDGTYVCASSSLGPVIARRLQRSRMEETLEVRQALEQEAARLAAERRSPEHLETMRECLRLCGEATEAGDLEAYVQADFRLHQTVVDAAQNSVLGDLYGHINNAVRLTIGSALDRLSPARCHVETHRRLVEAIAAKRPHDAAEAVRAIIDLSLTAVANDNDEEHLR